MRSRQEEISAHQHQRQRVVSALISHDPNPARSPLSQSWTATLVSMVVALIAVAGVFAYTEIKGESGPGQLRDETAVFIEQETGAQYVYTKADDRLHPVANYSSGLLLAASDRPNVKTISGARLAALQRRTNLPLGATLGIPDAPKSLPSAGKLLRGPWRVCSRPAAADAPPRTDLTVGGPGAAGGHRLATPEPGRAGQALVATDTAGSTFLIYANHKFLIRKPAVMRSAFAWNGRATRVSGAWLNTVPSGPDLEPLPIAGLRGRSAVLGKRIGQLYRAPGPGQSSQWAVLLRAGVLRISEVDARLLGADPQTSVGEPVAVSAAEFSALPPSDATVPPGHDLLPTDVPAFVNTVGAVCVTVTDAASGVTAVLVDPQSPAADAAAPQRAVTRPGAAAMADLIAVPFGHGVLVEPAASPTAPAGTSGLHLITDTGLRYPVADRTALARLGYGGSTPLRLPSELVALVPAGPTLDPRAARDTRR